MPLGRHVIGCRWVLCIKLKVNGQIDEYKVCLIAKGYSQVRSIHYTRTFSLVVKLSSNRILMTFIVEKWLQGPSNRHKNSFLMVNSRKIYIYMKQLEGFIQTKKDNLVCELNKSLYGLKLQSLWAWYACINTYLRQNVFEKNMANINIYVKRMGALFVAIALYINDYTIITNDCKQLLSQTKNLLCVKFEMINMGEINIVLVSKLKGIVNYIWWS